MGRTDASGDAETESVPVDPARLPRVTRLARGPPMGRQPCAGECGRWAGYRLSVWRVPRYLCRDCLDSALEPDASGDTDTAGDASDAEGDGAADGSR